MSAGFRLEEPESVTHRARSHAWHHAGNVLHAALPLPSRIHSFSPFHLSWCICDLNTDTVGGGGVTDAGNTAARVGDGQARRRSVEPRTHQRVGIPPRTAALFVLSLSLSLSISTCGLACAPSSLCSCSFRTKRKRTEADFMAEDLDVEKILQKPTAKERQVSVDR